MLCSCEWLILHFIQYGYHTCVITINSCLFTLISLIGIVGDDSLIKEDSIVTDAGNGVRDSKYLPWLHNNKELIRK